MLYSTADIYTYTPIIYNTVYIILIRHCKHLLVVVYKNMSCIYHIILCHVRLPEVLAGTYCKSQALGPLLRAEKSTRTRSLNSLLNDFVREVTVWSKGGKYKCDIRCDFV